ncbi:hypothetical protein [Burkholderia multivorans]|uniref:hypothetical protein n=1 Tax=Burkholderia multivorans TaxID=87883 RepID=UPI00158DF5D9|nr:hypothetical protein [Burkholderia multivorans]
MYKKNHSRHEAPLVVQSTEGKKIRNPNEITVNQHVIPQAHLKEWSRGEGLLNVFDKQKESWLTPAPHDAFTVQRLWDQWTETTFLSSNERNYQNQASLIKTSQPIESHEHISAYFYMLCIRARVAAKERPDYPSIMELSSSPSTQDELEDIELQNVGSSVHMSHPGGEGSQSLARETVKMAMNTLFLRGIQKFSGMVWTPFDMEDEDAVFPDSLAQLNESGLAILPITPKIVLIGAGSGNGLPSDFELTSSAINKKLIGSSVRYYVATSQTST